MAYKYGDGSRSDELVKLMIPVMILWSKFSWNEFHSYKDLMVAINAKTPRLGKQLGYIDDIFKELSRDKETSIPTLNALVVNASTCLPSDGFDYVDSKYSGLSKRDKEMLAKGRNEEAHAYDYTWVLDELDLVLPTQLPSSLVHKARHSSKNSVGGEGVAHAALKEFIVTHPESVNIFNHTTSETEYSLVSGDRVDVVIKTPEEIWAVEVKSHISDEQDILRGIYQCVKYKAVMEAEKIIQKNDKTIKTLLVLEGKMPIMFKKVADFLNVECLDKFVIW